MIRYEHMSLLGILLSIGIIAVLAVVWTGNTAPVLDRVETVLDMVGRKRADWTEERKKSVLGQALAAGLSEEEAYKVLRSVETQFSTLRGVHQETLEAVVSIEIQMVRERRAVGKDGRM